MEVFAVLVLLAIAFVGGLVVMYLICRKNMQKLADVEQAVKVGVNLQDVYKRVDQIIKR